MQVVVGLELSSGLGGSCIGAVRASGAIGGLDKWSERGYRGSFAVAGFRTLLHCPYASLSCSPRTKRSISTCGNRRAGDLVTVSGWSACGHSQGSRDSLVSIPRQKGKLVIVTTGEWGTGHSSRVKSTSTCGYRGTKSLPG